VQLGDVETEENVKENLIGKKFQRRNFVDIIDIHVSRGMRMRWLTVLRLVTMAMSPQKPGVDAFGPRMIGHSNFSFRKSVGY